MVFHVFTPTKRPMCNSARVVAVFSIAQRQQLLPYWNLVLDWVGCQDCEHKPTAESVNEYRLLNRPRPESARKLFRACQMPGAHLPFNQYRNSDKETHRP